MAKRLIVTRRLQAGFDSLFRVYPRRGRFYAKVLGPNAEVSLSLDEPYTIGANQEALAGL